MKKERYRFILVKTKNKNPLEEGWQNNTNYKYDDEKLLRHIFNGGNYGVVGGFGNLFVIDFDDEQIQEEKTKMLPKTFSVMSGSGKLHLYYHIDNAKSWKIIDEKERTLVDFQGIGKMVVGAGSIHPNGNTYKIVDNIPIVTITQTEIREVFKDLIQKYDLLKIKPTHSFGKDKIRDEIKSRITVTEILSSFGIDTTKSPTQCPFHDSKGGKCLGYNNEVWHCFHCDDKGDVFTLLMKKNNLSFVETKKLLMIKLGIEKEEGVGEGKTRIIPKKKEENVVYTSFIIIEGVLYEQVYDAEKNCCNFVSVTQTEQKQIINEVSFLEHNGLIYKTHVGEELRENVVLLPKKALVFNNIIELLNEIKTHIHKYCDVSEEFEELATYYVLLTYVYDQFNEIPYLSLQGDTGTGKSRVRDTIGMLCYKPILNNGGTSAAALYRITQKWKGTMLIDEADIKNSDEQNDVIKYLNCGFQKNSPIIKCDKNDPNILNFFNPYCPKIVTRRQSWEDKATESRCITEIMQTTNRKDIPFNFPKKYVEEHLQLRNKLLMFRLLYWKNYNEMSSEHITEFFKDISIEPRLKQTTSSIITLLQPFPEQLSKFKQFLVKKQEELIEERANSEDGEMINAIHELLEVQKKDFIITQDIVDILNQEETNPKLKIKARSITSKLKSFGIKSEKSKRVNNKIFRTLNIDSGKMQELYKKYGCYDVTIVTMYMNTNEINTHLPNSGLMAEKGGGVTVDTLSSSTVTTVTSVTHPKTSQNQNVLKLNNQKPQNHNNNDVLQSSNRKPQQLNNQTTIQPNKIKDYELMLKFVKNQDYQNNDVALYELFDEKMIQQAIEKGDIYQPICGWFKLV